MKKLSPLNQRRLNNFVSNKRGLYSFWIFFILFIISLFADFIANEKPLLVNYQNKFYFPILQSYSETTFGGDFETEADYRDPFVKNLINESGWMIMPIIPYKYNTIIRDIDSPAPSPPSKKTGLELMIKQETFYQDSSMVLEYQFYLDLRLLFFSMIIGVSAGAIQGYFGGKTDLFFQRFMEIWSAVPTLYVLIILASVIQPNFWWLLIILLLFSWMGYVGVVRAEFLRARNFDYIRAAKALGVSTSKIIFRHMIPNATVATVTFLPFSLSASVTALSGLDFLGFGLPPGSASLGEMVNQGRNNLQAPWLGLTSFFTLGLMLGLLVFIGEAVRDALDPRKTFK